MLILGNVTLAEIVLIEAGKIRKEMLQDIGNHGAVFELLLVSFGFIVSKKAFLIAARDIASFAIVYLVLD